MAARTGQRLIEAADLPLDISVVAAELGDGACLLTFSDEHRAAFPYSVLDEALANLEGGSGDALRLWRGDLDPLPASSFSTASSTTPRAVKA